MEFRHADIALREGLLRGLVGVDEGRVDLPQAVRRLRPHVADLPVGGPVVLNAVGQRLVDLLVLLKITNNQPISIYCRTTTELKIHF